MTKFEEEVKETYEKVSINLYGNNAGSIGMKKLLNELKDTGLLKEQQALPVVPEFVGIWIKKCQELNWMITDVLAPESWSSDFAKDTEKWLKESKENFNLLALAFITGKYEVEKPQLFYLRDELTGQFLAKDNQFKDKDRYFFWTGADPLTHSIGTAWKLSFTQAEIDSMETGSYELVPVEDGE